MPLERLLQQETRGLSDDALREVIRFVRFIKLESTWQLEQMADQRPSLRSAGKYRGQGWMAEDFDAPLEEFREYMA